MGKMGITVHRFVEYLRFRRTPRFFRVMTQDASKHSERFARADTTLRMAWCDRHKFAPRLVEMTPLQVLIEAIKDGATYGLVVFLVLSLGRIAERRELAVATVMAVVIAVPITALIVLLRFVRRDYINFRLTKNLAIIRGYEQRYPDLCAEIRNGGVVGSDDSSGFSAHSESDAE